jgi:hypothetical protein
MQSKQPINVICIQWGSKYNAQDINTLFSGVVKNTSFPVRFHLFSNETLPGLKEGIRQHPEPAPQQRPGKPYNYRKEVGLCTAELADLKGHRVFFFDLDVLITGNLDELFAYPQDDLFYIINDWNTRGSHVGQASCYSFVAGTLAWIKEAFDADPEAVIRRFGTASQEYLSHMIIQRDGALNFWPDEWFKSFRFHCLPPAALRLLKTPALPPAGTKVLVFHGQPDVGDARIGRWSNAASTKHAHGWKKIYKTCRPTPWIADYLTGTEGPPQLC